METLWINGEYMPVSEGRVHVEDRALLFGEGIYEVIAAYKGVPILLEEHLDRWERSAAGLRLPQAYSREQRIEVLYGLLEKFGGPRASLYGQLTRGSSRRAHQLPAVSTPTEYWFVREMPTYKPEMFTAGVKVYTHLDERWARRWIKSTSLLPNCLAKQYAAERGGFEAILFEENGIVTEGAVANFWVVKDGVLHTHPANGRILGGCKRAMVMEIAKENGIPVKEDFYNLDFMFAADEAFLTSTTINVLPVVEVDDRRIGAGKPGPISAKLLSLVGAAIAQMIEEVSLVPR